MCKPAHSPPEIVGFIKTEARQAQEFLQLFDFIIRGCLSKPWPCQAPMFFMSKTCGKNTQITTL
jgi:hypothetical protein